MINNNFFKELYFQTNVYPKISTFLLVNQPLSDADLGFGLQWWYIGKNHRRCQFQMEGNYLRDF